MDGQAIVGGSDFFVVQYDSTGVKQWTEQRGSGNDDFLSNISIDATNRVYAIGTTWGALGDQLYEGGGDLFIQRLCFSP